jgi:hypothetical protein
MHKAREKVRNWRMLKRKGTRNNKNKNEIRSAEEDVEDSNSVQKTVTACANRCFDCIPATKSSSITFSTI